MEGKTKQEKEKNKTHTKFMYSDNSSCLHEAFTLQYNTSRQTSHKKKTKKNNTYMNLIP
jgi:dynactin complex subunit